MRLTTLRNTYRFLRAEDGALHLVPLNPGGIPDRLRAHARADALETAKDFVSSAVMRGAQLTEEDAQAIALLKAEIARLDAPYHESATVLEDYGSGIGSHRGSGFDLGEGNGWYPHQNPSAPKRQSYRKIFGSTAPLSMDGFENSAEYFDLLRKGVPDPRFKMGASFGGSTGAGGGYTLPSAISASLLDSLLEASVVLPRARIVPMSDRVVSVWGFDNENQSVAGTLMGGIEFAVVPENSQASLQSGRVRAVRLEAKKLMAVTKVSVELLSDARAFESELRNQFSLAAGAVLDDMLLNGSGAGGEFLGVLNCPSKITVSASGQTSSTYVYNNAISQRARLMDGGEPIWIANQDTLPQLYQMTLANAGLVQAFDGRDLLGIPVVVSSRAQSVGTEGDVILADLSKFIVGLRQEINIESSAHFAFDSHEVAFRLVMRLDSADSLTQAVTPRYSSSTLGWAVTLSTRTS